MANYDLEDVKYVSKKTGFDLDTCDTALDKFNGNVSEAIAALNAYRESGDYRNTDQPSSSQQIENEHGSFIYP